MRGSRVHALYARTVQAKAARAIVIPAQPARGMQVTHCLASNECRRLREPVQPRCWISQCRGASFWVLEQSMLPCSHFGSSAALCVWQGHDRYS